MAAKNPAPAPQEKRFTAYMGWLAQAVGHADRNVPLQSYCTGLLLDGEGSLEILLQENSRRLAP